MEDCIRHRGRALSFVMRTVITAGLKALVGAVETFPFAVATNAGQCRHQDYDAAHKKPTHGILAIATITGAAE